MKKLLSIAIIVVLANSIFFTVLPTRGGTTIADVEPVDWQSGLAGKVLMPKLDPAEAGQAAHAAAIMSAPDPPRVGTTVWDWYLRTLSRTIYPASYPNGYPYMTLRAISGNVEVWVASDRMLMFQDGDPRNDNPLDWNITDAMCQFLADEFNNVIYPTDVNSFGAPSDKDGTNTLFEQLGWPAYRWDWIATDNPQRVTLKIFNIVDSSYYNPTYPSYVVGFYDPTYTIAYYNRNMIHMDNWRYWQRLGPMGYEWISGHPELNVTRPYVYESTVAHEFQHDLHADWNPSDDAFMNEGCSMYAELLCGYGIDTNYLNYYFYSPDNSLTMWSDQGDINVLADYGESALWAIYLSDHYGGTAFLRTFVQAGIPGVDGVNAALAFYHYKQRFNDVFHDWRLANLIRADFPGCHKYNYDSLDLNAPDIIPVRTYAVSGLPVPVTTGTSFGNTITLRGYDTGVSRLTSYGTDYIKFQNWNRAGFVYFDGDETALFGWRMTPDGWWSGEGNMLNTLLSGTAYVDPADPTLTLVTAYGLETNWDFGFVQVSTDNGLTWTSLENENTTYDCLTVVQAIVDNLPGLTDYNPEWPSWTTMAFDLTPYSGQTVKIGFRYMTDEFMNYEGWFIQSASVSGTALTLAGTYPKASYMVTLVNAIVVKGKTSYIPLDMRLTESTNKGMGVGYTDKSSYVVMVVSPTMPNGDVDYKFQATKIPLFKFLCDP